MRDPFPDVDLNHPWVKDLRLPVLKDMYPTAGYIVTLTAPPPENEANNYFNIAMPTDEDARIASLYLQFVISKQGYRKGYLDKMAEAPLDIDSGYNTVSISKRQDGTWVYRRTTWSQVFAPIAWENRPETKSCKSLIELLDYIEMPVPTTEKRKAEWMQWKQDNKLA